MRWVFPADGGDRGEGLAKELGIHPVAARVLVARGLATAQAAAEFMRDGLADLPDPHLMLDMDKAVDRLARALVKRERITLYGDYDVDGVTSTATLATFLRAVGADFRTYIPHRIGEGYGLNADAVVKLAKEGTQLLVTLDCGISAVEEIDKAVQSGLEVVVVDHHQVGPVLPRAFAILNPHRPGCAYPSKQLCAAGIAFMLLMALRKRLRETGFFTAERPEPNLREYLDLTALGTVADVVPLTGANRILVKHGLAELAKSRKPGVRALKDVAGIGPGPVTAGQVGFRLGPRINAAGRLNDASVGVELLLSADPARAASLAKTLDQANTERQLVEKGISEQAMLQAEELAGRGVRGLVLAADGWHPGVIGIVAARVVEKFHRPTFVIGLNDGAGKGSGRSVEGFHLYEALKHCAPHLTRYGGHKHAAGLSLEAKALPAFREAFEGLAKAQLAESDLTARCRIDAVVGLDEITENLTASLEKLAPFGAGNPEPVLAAHGIRANGRVLQSKTGGAGHLKLALENARHLDVIGFGLGESANLTAAPVDAAFTVGTDEWNGVPRLSLKLKALRAAG